MPFKRQALCQINVKESYFIIINITTVVHPVAIISLESCEIRKGHSVDRFSSELLDISLQPLTFNWCFFFHEA